MPLLKPVRGAQLDKTHLFARGLVGCWLMNEGMGAKVFDLTGNGNTGALQGDAAWHAGKHGFSLIFDGTSDYVDCGQSELLLTDEVSVVAWAKRDTQATYYQHLIQRGQYHRPFSIETTGSGTDAGARFAIRTSAINTLDSDDGFYSLGEWAQFAGTYRSGDQRVYINGHCRNTSSTPTGALDSSGAQDICIGACPVSLDDCLDGNVDHILVYNRCLSDEEIAWLYREPFCMFESPIRPGLIFASAPVPLAGSATAQSAASATLKSVRSTREIERNWLREALFSGMTLNAFKLGTTLSLGWFWFRVTGCSALYRGPSMEQIDLTNILAVAELDADEFSPPSYLLHNSNSTYFYVVRRFNHCGYQERTLTAAVKVSIESSGDLAQPQPNKVFASRAEQVSGNKIKLTWFYCPLEQGSQPVRFNVYYDGQTGQIDYETPLVTIGYEGRKFYSYQSDALAPGKYSFVVRAEDASGIENGSSAQLSVRLSTANPDPIGILGADGV